MRRTYLLKIDKADFLVKKFTWAAATSSGECFRFRRTLLDRTLEFTSTAGSPEQQTLG